MIATMNQIIIKLVPVNKLQYNHEQYKKNPESVDKTRDIYRIQQ